MIIDPYGRSFSKLRISLTNHCNFSCVYCVSDAEAKQNNALGELSDAKLGTGNPLNLNEYLHIVKVLHQKLHLQSIKITGGEPLLFKEVGPLIRGIHEIGIQNISLTTNGHLLKQKSKMLKDAGLTAINVSLDSVSPELFHTVTRRGKLEPVLEAIDQSIEDGLTVKLNAVIMKGINDSQVVPLLEFAMRKNILLRYIELMQMGPLHANINEHFFSVKEILEQITQRYEIHQVSKEKNDTSNYWTINGQKAFGIIANESIPFCSDCNRLRLDSYGNIYGCLSNLIGLPIKDQLQEDAKLEQSLKTALSHKQELRFKGNLRTMKSIGG